MTESSFDEFTVKRIAEKFCAKRSALYPPDQLYVSYRLDAQALYVLEIRPQWNDAETASETMVAKLVYQASARRWALYWQRTDLEWARYKRAWFATRLESLLDIVWEDRHDCFWS